MSGENILLLDTEKNVLITYKNALEEEGYRVDFAETEYDALEKLSKKTFSLLITEFQLKGTNSLNLIRFVKENKPDTPIILLTASALTMPAYEAVQDAGVLECLMKPFPVAKLLVIIKKGLRMGQYVVVKKTLEEKLHYIESYALNAGQQFIDMYHFLKALRNELKRSERFKHPFSVLVIKTPQLSISSSECEKQIGHIALNTVRVTDAVSRIDGTYNLLLPETPRTGIIALTERLRRKIIDHAATVHDPQLNSFADGLSFSHGSFPDEPAFINQFIETLQQKLTPVDQELSAE